MSFKVTFSADSEPTNYPDSAYFKIGDDGVLIISDGDEVIHYAPHAWVQVRSSQVGPTDL